MDNFLKSYYIVKTLALNELKIRYKRNILGFFWSLLNPVLHISLISLVFSNIMQMPYKQFMLFLMPGLMSWNLFVNIVNSCSNSLVNNERIIKNISINKILFPIIAAATVLCDFFLAFSCILFLCLIFSYNEIRISVLFLPISLIMMTMFALSTGLIISIINVYIRDIGYIINMLLQIIFFMTPILYDKSKLGIYSNLAKLNPILHFIDLFRQPIYGGSIPNFETIIISSAWIVILSSISLTLYKRTKDLIVFRL